MQLQGSCHCGAVRFSVRSRHPYPYNRCYCSICRKTAGTGGYAINIRGDIETLSVEGGDDVRTYNARKPDGELSPLTRHFCQTCGSALWISDPRWPEMCWPHAGAIDTPLPVPPERTHLMLGSKAAWVEPCIAAGDKTFERYPDEGIAEWHERLNLVDE